MKKFNLISLLSALFVVNSAYSASVMILNDSPYILTATVLSATGTILGRVQVTQQQQQTWQDSNLNVDGLSQTPFTVIFYCPTGEEYGVVTNVSTSGFVSASSSSGNKVCKAPKPKPGEQQTDEYKGEIYNPKNPVNPDQWNEGQRY